MCIRPKSADERHMAKAYVLEDRICEENSSEFERSCAEVVLQNNAWKEQRRLDETKLWLLSLCYGRLTLLEGEQKYSGFARSARHVVAQMK